MTTSTTHRLTVYRGPEQRTWEVPHGANLRRALLAAALSPYGTLSRRLNCGGRGLCATCGVWVRSGAVPPTHWHDRLGRAFGYPRLSCQITVTTDLQIELLVDKTMWGRPQRPDESPGE